jgi:hypothetical protein
MQNDLQFTNGKNAPYAFDNDHQSFSPVMPEMYLQADGLHGAV